MIIGCPSCSARFIVKAQAIGDKGRKVKCARCKHTWFQEPDLEVLEAAKQSNAVDAPEDADPVPNGANVPAVKKEGISFYLKIAAMVAFICFSLTITLINANNILPSMPSYYALFGIYDATDIALYDIKVEKVESGKYNDVLVSGKIVNESEIHKKLPALRMTIISDEGEELKTITLESDGATLSPGERLDFEDRIPKLPNNAAKLIMDLGNALDLASR
jgi:predicted Zn finger-like uncharacterized protein